MQQNLRFALIVFICAGLIALVWLMLHGGPDAPTAPGELSATQHPDTHAREHVPSAPRLDTPPAGRMDSAAHGGRTSVSPHLRDTPALPGVILGRVQGPGGTPADGATVAVLQTEGENPLLPTQTPVTRETRTGADGEFAVTGLPLGYYSVLARTHAHAQAERAYLSIERPVADIEIRLTASGDVSGVVRNARGERAAGVRLWTIQPAGAEQHGLPRPMRRSDDFGTQLLTLPEPVVSCAEGEFHFAGLPRVPTQILAMPQDAAPVLSGPVQPSHDGLAIELTAGGAVSGRVILDGTEEPLADVAVVLKGGTVPERFETVTREDGGFDFGLLRPGTCELAMRDERYVLAKGILPRVRVRDGETETGIVLRAVAASSIAGHVYDRESQRPLPGVYVTARGEGLASAVTVKTDRAGAYTLSGMGPGEHRVSAIAPSLRFAFSQETGNEATVALAPGQMLDGLDFHLAFGAGIQGYVVEEQGRPVPYADVFISTQQGSRLRMEKADEQGYFVSAGLTPGTRVLLQARRLGLVSPEPVSVEAPSHGLSSDVTLAILPGARIEGRVVRSSGAAAANAPVYLTTAQAFALRVNDVQSAGDDGTFSWDGLPAGEFAVGIVAQRTRDGMTAPSAEVRVAAGEKSEPVRLIWDGPVSEESRADRETGDRAIRGRVTGRQGDPIPGVSINARSPTGYGHRVETLHDGTFEIAGIPAGIYALRAFHRNYTPAEATEVRAGDHAVKIVLEEAARATGQIIDAATGQPIPEFEVAQASIRFLEREPSLAGVGWERAYDPEGRFSISLGLGRDARVILARAEGYAPQQQPIGEVTAGQEVANLVFRLRSGAVVEGVVRDVGGNPVSGASIYQGAQERRGPALARTGAHGDFRAEGLESGNIALTASHPNFAPDTRTIDARLGGVTRAEFVLSSGGTVEGYVLKGRNPISRQMVSLNIADRNENVVTDANGHYRFDRLPAGEGAVFVHLRGQASGGSQFLRAQRAVIVAHNRVTRVDFQFSEDDATIEGVVSIEGVPTAHAHVALTLVSSGGEQRTGTNVDANGFYRLENLMPGSAILEITTRGRGQRRSKTVAFEVQAGQRVLQDIDFGPEAVIAGTVRGGRQGEEVYISVLPGAVEAERPTLEEVQYLAALVTAHAPVSPDGTFEVGNLEPGTYTVVAVAIQGEPDTELEAYLSARYASQIIEIEPGQPLNISLNLR